MFILNTSDTKCINYLFKGTFTVQKTSNEHYKNLFIENEHHIHHIVLMTNSTLYIICNSFTCKQLWAKPMVNWYSITLGGHTEGWKITFNHKQTILMSSENKDVVMASITHSRIKDGRNCGLPARVVNFTQRCETRLISSCSPNQLCYFCRTPLQYIINHCMLIDLTLHTADWLWSMDVNITQKESWKYAVLLS